MAEQTTHHGHGPLTVERHVGFYIPSSTFPAVRGQLVCEARRSNAPDAVVRTLQRLAPPPVRYEDMSAVLAEINGFSRVLHAVTDRCRHSSADGARLDRRYRG
jgi:hypothetical protein